jgi:hypothetical protein
MRPRTAAKVDFVVQNNQTWQDPLQFGTPGDTTWSLTGQNFTMDIKGSPYDVSAFYTLSTGSGTIVVDDAIQRVIHFNVPDAVIQADLPIGEYVYDLIMFDSSSPAIRIPLCRGKVKIIQGVSAP